MPNSSTYNFSDDDEDDEKTANKRIPLWAQGKFFYYVETSKAFSADNLYQPKRIHSSLTEK